MKFVFLLCSIKFAFCIFSVEAQLIWVHVKRFTAVSVPSITSLLSFNNKFCKCWPHYVFEFDTPTLDRMRRVLELVPTDLGQHLERTHAAKFGHANCQMNCLHTVAYKWKLRPLSSKSCSIVKTVFKKAPFHILHVFTDALLVVNPDARWDEWAEMNIWPRVSVTTVVSRRVTDCMSRRLQRLMQAT